MINTGAQRAVHRRSSHQRRQSHSAHASGNRAPGTDTGPGPSGTRKPNTNTPGGHNEGLRRSQGRKSQEALKQRSGNRSVSGASARSRSKQSSPSVKPNEAYSAGDHVSLVETEVEVDPKTEKMHRRKLGIIIMFTMYAVILSIAFILNVTILALFYSREVKYYVRVGTFADVVLDFSSIMMKVIIGSIIHFIAAIYAILVLKGASRTESIVLRFKERFLSCLLGIAIIGEVSLVSSGVDYFASFPLVTNGIMDDTIRPPAPHSSDRGCFPKYSKFKPENDDLTPHVRVNMRWFLEVICMNPKRKEWRKNYTMDGNLTPGCKGHLKELHDWEREDCHLVDFLYYVQFVYLCLDFTGLIFCAILCFVYIRAEVKTNRPARFSISRQVDIKELELQNLKEFGKKRNTEITNENIDKAIGDGEIKKKKKKKKMSKSVTLVTADEAAAPGPYLKADERKREAENLRLS